LVFSPHIITLTNTDIIYRIFISLDSQNNLDLITFLILIPFQQMIIRKRKEGFKNFVDIFGDILAEIGKVTTLLPARSPYKITLAM